MDPTPDTEDEVIRDAVSQKLDFPLVNPSKLTPWAGTYAWISWRVTAWDLGLAAYFAHTRTGLVWWIARRDTMGRLLKVFEGLLRGNHFPPPF